MREREDRDKGEKIQVDELGIGVREGRVEDRRRSGEGGWLSIEEREIEVRRERLVRESGDRVRGELIRGEEREDDQQ